MKIRLVIADSKTEYLESIRKGLNQKFSAFLDLAVFSDLKKVQTYVKDTGANVLLISEEFAKSAKSDIKLPERVSVGILTKEADAVEVNGQPALNKFSDVDRLYNFILKLYGESVKNVKFDASRGKDLSNLFTFVGPANRVTSDATAVAFAKTLAVRGAKVLYVDLHTLATVDQFFESTVTPDSSLSSVIYQIKAKRGNLSAQLALATGTTAEGVSFVVPPTSPADAAELKLDEKLYLVKEILALSQFNCFVFSLPFGLDASEKHLFAHSDQIFVQSNGSSIENALVAQVAQALKDVDAHDKTENSEKLGVVYLHNERASFAKLPKVPEIADVTTIGDLGADQLVDSIVNFDIFGVFAARFN